MYKTFLPVVFTTLTSMPVLACSPNEPQRYSWFENLVINNAVILVGSVSETHLVDIPHRYGANEYVAASIDVTNILRGEWNYPIITFAPAVGYSEGDRVFIFLSSNRLGDDFDFMPLDQPFAGLPLVLCPCGHSTLKIEPSSDQRIPLLFELLDGQGDMLEKAIALDLRLRVEKEGSVAPSVEQSPRPPVRP